MPGATLNSRPRRSIDAGGPAPKRNLPTQKQSPPLQDLPPAIAGASAKPGNKERGVTSEEDPRSDREIYYPETMQGPATQAPEAPNGEEDEDDEETEEEYTPEDFGYSDEDDSNNEWGGDEDTPSLKDEVNQAADKLLQNPGIKNEVSMEAWIVIGELLTPPVTLIGLPILSIYVWMARRDKDLKKPWLHLLSKPQEWLIIGLDILLIILIPLLIIMFIYSICQPFSAVGLLVTIASKINGLFGGTDYCGILK
jgi:hypothetical protein